MLDFVLYKGYNFNGIIYKLKEDKPMKCCKKVLKIVGVIAAVAAAVAGVYFAITKIKAKKAAAENEEECYVSCSCCEAE